MSGCEAKLDALFDRIARERLPPPDSGHRFINGDTMGVEDVALAALAAPVVVPPGYCAGRYTRYFAALSLYLLCLLRLLCLCVCHSLPSNPIAATLLPSRLQTTRPGAR